ncbi:MAG: esterase [Alistipes sp.]|nr:esterase [Alistipes sp.]
MKRLFLFMVLVVMCAPVGAQQTIGERNSTLSPEILEDGRVTFRLAAAAAERVELTGDMLPQQLITSEHGSWKAPGVVPMTRREDGVWEYTTPEPLASDLYNYNMIVDGVKITDPGNVHTVRDIASIFNLLIVPGGKGDIFSVQDVPHGSLSTVWYPTEDVQHRARRVTIYTPADYLTSNQRYPVLYLLHGMGGDEEAWVGLGRAAQIFDNMIAQGRMKPMIVVMPNGNMAHEAAPGQSHEGLIRPEAMLPRTMDGSYEEQFIDIVNFVDKYYRTHPDSDHRAIAGLSMGGFHSLHIAQYYPGVFGYVGLFSAAVFRGDAAKSEVYRNPEARLQELFATKPHLFWIGIGEEDFLYKENVSLREKLDALNYPYIYHESKDGHIWRNWRDYLVLFVEQLF